MLRRSNPTHPNVIDTYIYVGHSTIEFSLEDKNQELIISEALNFYEEEIKRGGFGFYCLQQLDLSISALDIYSNKFITNLGYLIIFGPMIKGSHVYRLYE